MEYPRCKKCNAGLFAERGYAFKDYEGNSEHWSCANCKAMREFAARPMFPNSIINWMFMPRVMRRQYQTIREFTAILNREDEQA